MNIHKALKTFEGAALRAKQSFMLNFLTSEIL